jgi:hypothetical protein
MFCPDPFARAPAGVLMYRKYIPRVPPKPGLGFGANHLVFSYVFGDGHWLCAARFAGCVSETVIGFALRASLAAFRRRSLALRFALR